MNKSVKRLVSFVLTLVMVCSILPPVTIGAANYIIPVSTVEEFMAIMDAPDRSYMLTEDLDLGAINPLGYDPGTGKITPFTGTLDGSGHRITYSVNPSAQLNHYALFAWLDGAEIANLSVHGKLKAELSNGNTSFVGILAGRMDNSTVGGGTFSGSVDVSGSAGWTNIGNIVGFCDSSAQLNRVTARVDTTVNARDDMAVRYYALSYCHDSFAYGSAKLTGNIDFATAIYYSFNTRSSQNMTIKPSCESVIRGIYDGEYNTYSAIITVTPQGTDSLTITLDGISDGTANTFEGDLRCSGPTAGSLTACMANGGTGQTVKGNLTISGSGRSYAYGMYECDYSTMEGNISVAHSSKATGLHNCTDCILNGSIALTAQWNNARVYGANKGEHNQLNCNLSITSGWDNAGVYGLIECPESSFNGSLSAKGKTRAHAIGACNATHNVVHANITVNCDAVGSTGGEATGVSSTSSCFEGSISCPGGFVQGCGNDSIAKGSLSGQHVTATGDGSLFTGSIRASAASDMAQPSVSIVGAFRGSVSVTGRDNGACFFPGICFSGSASVSAQDGLITVHALEGTSVSIRHGASGVSGTSQSLVDKGDREDVVEVYWHRYAKEWGCTKDYHPYMDYSYHSYLMECYQNVINVAILENSNPDLSDLGWKGSIDPVLGTYKPELEPTSYTIVVTDPKGNTIHSCRISVGGQWLYPDENGAFHIENGSAVISPLVVELQNADSTYTQVLRRTAYFPARNRINTIQLEPTVDQLTVSLVAADAPSNQNAGTWGGIRRVCSAKPWICSSRPRP